MKKEKKLHVGTLDQIKGFKNISLDLWTYERIFDLSQNNPFGVDLSVAKTIKYLYNYYSEHEALKKIKNENLTRELENAKVSKSQKVIKL